MEGVRGSTPIHLSVKIVKQSQVFFMRIVKRQYLPIGKFRVISNYHIVKWVKFQNFTRMYCMFYQCICQALQTETTLPSNDYIHIHIYYLLLLVSESPWLSF